MSRLALAALVVSLLAACGSQADPSRSLPTGTATLAATASATAVPSATAESPSSGAPPTSAGGLTLESSTFGDADGQSRATALTSFNGGLIAVGVSYEMHLPILGPLPPHTGRIWSSPDGRSWADVTPANLLTNVTLRDVVYRGDGTLLAVGDVAAPDQYGDLSPGGTGAWMSSDGVTWKATEVGIPSDRLVLDMVAGPRGILAVVRHMDDTARGSEIWFSLDGYTWDPVRDLADGTFSVAAGTEGFVAVKPSEPIPGGQPTFAIASADGREWFEAADAPPLLAGVAAVGPDWVAVTADHSRDEGWVETSESANGLDWSAPVPVDADELAARVDESGCWFAPSLISAGEWLVLRTFRAGLCSEGGATSFGPHLARTDTGRWVALPLSAPDTDRAAAASWVASAAIVDGTLVLAGESGGSAAFWWVSN